MTLSQCRYTVRDTSKYRHKILDTKRGMLGMCYILHSQSHPKLPGNDAVGFKNIMVVRDAMGGKRHQTREGFDDHAAWGGCQVGASATFVNEKNDDDLALFGAPGCFTWRGNVFSQHVGTSRPYDTVVNRESFRDFSKHGLMGLSVTSGKFFNDQTYYVSGAPHAATFKGRTGKVYFFKTDPGSGTQLSPDWKRTLEGEYFGAGFGYSLAKVDANGDGSPDLVVGAPFHDGTQNKQNSGGGAIYLYLSKNKVLSQHNCVKVLGKELESQFGLSISSTGDLNKDGYDDFAVGAPYESNGKGAVYIFFGGGQGLRSQGPAKTFYLATEVADQIITASELVANAPNAFSSSLATFGSSLDGGMDMDENGYPDLLVGAYDSAHVVALRSRPIIDVTTFVDDRYLKGIDPGTKGCPDDPDADDTCFGFMACFRVVDQEKDVTKSGLHIKYVIEAEPKKPVSRVWLRPKDDYYTASSNKSNLVTGRIVIQKGDSDHCTNIIGYVGTRNSDLQSPVEFAMTYSLVQTEPSMEYSSYSSLPNINNYPILNQAQAKKKFQATFDRDCGEDEVCQAGILMTPKLTDRDGVELPRTPGGEFYQLQLGSLKNSELVLDLNINNTLEPAYEATLDIQFPSSISYIGTGKETRLSSPELKNSTWLSLNLGNPFRQEASRLQLRFSPRKDMNESIVVFFMGVQTSSEQVYDSSTYTSLVIVRRAEVKVVGGTVPERVHYGGRDRVLGESAMNQLSDIGPQIIHKFVVINSGPSMLDVLTVRIQWPFQVASDWPQGKWLLYLTDHPTLKNGRGACTLPPEYQSNPLNLTGYHNGIVARHAEAYAEKLVWNEIEQSFMNKIEDEVGHNNIHHHSRPKRDIEKVIVPRTVKVNDEKTKKVVTMDCDMGTAKCIPITCMLYDVPADLVATIEVRSRLWNSTLAEDYYHGYVDEVEIYSKASVIVNQDIIQDVSDDFVSVLTLATPDPSKGLIESTPDWWIILVSILIGLLVLVLISLILWRCGFFERKRPDEEDDDFMMSAHFERVQLNGGSYAT